jgi:hypothetical protein
MDFEYSIPAQLQRRSSSRFCAIQAIVSGFAVNLVAEPAA